MKPGRLAAAILCLPLLACYEEPVRDHLHLAFAPGPAIVVTAVRDIGPADAAGDNPAVEKRVEEASSDVERGWDRWSRGFSELDAVADRSTVERHEGRARRGIHSALLVDFQPLERLLGNEGLGAFFEDIGGVRELQLYPAGSGQATRQQRNDLERGLAEWCEVVSGYLNAVAALYEYLDIAPYRAAPCFAHVFDVHTGESGPLSDEEADLVTALKDRMERVADALLIDTGRAHSLNELSRLVFDTFQGRLTVAVDGPVLEVEGFDDHGAWVERPPVDLWRTLESMSAQWISPDIVTSLVQPGPEEAQPEADPVAFAGIPRRWAQPPDAWTVESELRRQLQPEDLYLVRWRTRPVTDDEDELYLAALQMLASAEGELPE
ncbi:MAG: hypothetical protein V2I67_17790 [Thermoanaerobaculales bacterium]|jgi:hypothetical protein|nr:hypothetical protein [Thermoanaerobaculales bacterium]